MHACMQLLIVSMTIFSQDTPTWPLSGGFCVLNLTAMNERSDMEEENVSISKSEEDED